MTTSNKHSFTIKTFTAGKNPGKNEDFFGYSTNTIVLSDGATDKTNIEYEKNVLTGEYKTGGEVAAHIVVQTALATNLNGVEFANAVTEAMREYYTKHTPQALADSAYRFAAGGTVLARIVNDKLVVTQVGDTSFRINGKDEYVNDKKIDLINANYRKKYIEKTGDISGGRKHILPRLQEQHKLQNNTDDPLGYGTLDGSIVPDKFIHVYSFSMQKIHTLELVTDGYFGAFPKNSTIEAYEKLHDYIETVDPYKIGKFKSTKVADDRTVLIANFDNTY